MRLPAFASIGLFALLVGGTPALAAPLPATGVQTAPGVQLVHRGPNGGWHCNRERWSKSLGWHYHSRRCSAWVPTERLWHGKRWQKGCWINRRGTLVCRF